MNSREDVFEQKPALIVTPRNSTAVVVGQFHWAELHLGIKGRAMVVSFQGQKELEIIHTFGLN